jgi:hypothetical protein
MSALRFKAGCGPGSGSAQCVTTMKSVSSLVSLLIPSSEMMIEEPGVSSSEICSITSSGIPIRSRAASSCSKPSLRRSRPSTMGRARTAILAERGLGCGQSASTATRSNRPSFSRASWQSSGRWPAGTIFLRHQARRPPPPAEARARASERG